jgi:hypothetical protein
MFTIRALLPVALVAWSLAPGCGETHPCDDNGVTAIIEDNHPSGSHELDIPASDVADGVDVVYDIQGVNVGHGHTVTVTAADFSALDDGQEVTLTSSDTGAVGEDHTHGIVLDCSP